MRLAALVSTHPSASVAGTQGSLGTKWATPSTAPFNERRNAVGDLTSVSVSF
jgi:hypothetical protein